MQNWSRFVMKPELIASCGINCAICVGYLGYTMSGTKRKHSCLGCRTSDESGKFLSRKNCAFLKKHCDLLAKEQVRFCFECDDFPCRYLKKLDDGYVRKYNTSLIENLNAIKDNGMKRFLQEQSKKYTCPQCGGTICVHTNLCYNCSPP